MRIKSDACRKGKIRNIRISFKGVFHLRQDPFGDAGGGIDRCHIAHEDHKLVTSDTPGHVHHADVTSEDTADLRKDPVSNSMTEGVIDAFKIIGIDHDQVTEIPLGIQVRHDCPDQFFRGVFVEKPGQNIQL